MDSEIIIINKRELTLLKNEIVEIKKKLNDLSEVKKNTNEIKALIISLINEKCDFNKSNDTKENNNVYPVKQKENSENNRKLKTKSLFLERNKVINDNNFQVNNNFIIHNNENNNNNNNKEIYDIIDNYDSKKYNKVENNKVNSNNVKDIESNNKNNNNDIVNIIKVNNHDENNVDLNNKNSCNKKIDDNKLCNNNFDNNNKDSNEKKVENNKGNKDNLNDIDNNKIDKNNNKNNYDNNKDKDKEKDKKDKNNMNNRVSWLNPNKSEVSIQDINNYLIKEEFDDQENIYHYDIRIKYYVELVKKEVNSKSNTGNILHLNMDYLRSCTNEDFIQKWIDYICQVINLNNILLYLMVEQEDLKEVINTAFEKKDLGIFCNNVKVLINRNTTLTNSLNKLNQDIMNKCNTISIKSDYIMDKHIMDYCKTQIRDISNRLSEYNFSGNIISKVKYQLNLKRLSKIYSHIKLLIKKVDTLNHISIYKCVDSNYSQLVDNLVKKYKSQLYDEEYYSGNNSLSFYLNKESFYEKDNTQ
ncbi:hypothetical protein BCR32DRAFT_301942 [Anaeromyces robustus]|uniref:Uncharacterized protein n=1 Tax=Anaeromyces robustus TaxID=1754192 RepID=A0A1Y1WXT3_9FUNG|nr:hypothetical protein BCR32DRAFT_301942 [Anaeromyces robustus]|eukprot:ORX78195.1 hypothetical protein BCR32DRAFT_301942 [Anaeromyces robustus]